MTKDEALKLALTSLPTAISISAADPPTQNPPFNFTRYVDGQEMAEGVVIEKEATLAAAIKRAVSLCPQRQNTVLVYVPLNREWVGLTDEEIRDIHWSKPMDEYSFARAIEAKLKEKNK